MNTTEDNLGETQRCIGYRFRDSGLLYAALTHRSFSHESDPGPNEDKPSVAHYERLEFLGDALLGFIAAAELYHSDPGADEGILTRRKQIVVRTRTLADIAASIGLGAAMRLGRGELCTGGRDKKSLLADVFEAVLAAVYLDGGIRPARAFVRRHLSKVIREATGQVQVLEDYKTRLQESVQRELRMTPVYRIVSCTGPDHSQVFQAIVQVGSQAVGHGEGSSRKNAEQAAALEALQQWKKIL